MSRRQIVRLDFPHRSKQHLPIKNINETQRTTGKFHIIKKIRSRSHLATTTQIFDVFNTIFYIIRIACMIKNITVCTTEKNTSLSSSANRPLGPAINTAMHRCMTLILKKPVSFPERSECVSFHLYYI